MAPLLKLSSRVQKMPMKESVPNFEGIARVHPVINIVLAKNNPTTNARLTSFLEYEYYHCHGEIPHMLHEFYGDYLEYAVQSYAQDNRQRSRVFPWNYSATIDGLARLAYYGYVSSRKITMHLVKKHMEDIQVVGIEKPTEGSTDLEFRSLGLLTMDETDTEGTSFRFREQIIVEYLVARFILNQFSAKLVTRKAVKMEDLLTPSVLTCIDRLPLTGDIWRITFGLLNQDENTQTIQAPLLYELVETCKNKDYLNSFEITSLCVEAIYESQNAGELSDLLDEFTLNQTINYANVPVIKQRYLYTIHAVGYLVRASPSVYGVHLNNVGLNEDRVALLTDPVNEVSDNNIQVLNISNNPLGDNGMKRLQRFIVKATLLTHLDMSSCSIGNLGIAILAEFFICIPLTYLRLANNNIGDVGLLRIAANFRNVRTLEWMDLSENLITDKSVVYMTTELHWLNSLRCLDLRNNQIGEVGLNALSQAIHVMPGLTQVMLAENRPGDESANVMAEHAWKTRSLKHVNLNLSQIPMQGILTMKRTAISLESLPSIEDEEAIDDTLNDTVESIHDVSLHFQPAEDEAKYKSMMSGLSVDLLEGRPDRNKAVYLRARSSATLPSRKSLRRSWHGLSSSFRESFRAQRGDFSHQKWDSTRSALAPQVPAEQIQASAAAPVENHPEEPVTELKPKSTPRLGRAASFRKSLTRIGSSIRSGFNRFGSSGDPAVTRKSAVKGKKSDAPHQEAGTSGAPNHIISPRKETTV